MKYTIEGFNQRNAISLGLNCEDLILLRWFVDFKNTSDMKKKYIEKVNDMGYWVSYSYLIKELPILFSTNPIYSENYKKLSDKERFDIDKKYIKACKQKIKRMLNGNLSKVLLRDKSTERDREGKIKSDIYIHINPTVFKLLISDDITEVQKCTTATEVQKCTTATEVQKCTIDTSTNNTYSSTTQSKQKSKDFSSSEKNMNAQFIEKNTHLILSKFQANKVEKFDLKRLEKAIEIFKEKGGQYFSLLEKVYMDNKNFAPNVSCTPKTTQHAINQTYTKYNADELENMLLNNQKSKFDNSNRLTKKSINEKLANDNSSDQEDFEWDY
ncbi:hypothetical protein WS9_007520 [Paraclostridium sordellii 8483]|uniref:hypothetical protein n=1 Tax=Paraclostridium sordellii TaxID=1505 RepID=UPI0002D2FD38|nr:hypothetical protein [Paeniclostridium sordellii]TAN67681.1 hypothetical protein WS9_007520 [Paeniclostridium sordellii 8483]